VDLAAGDVITPDAVRSVRPGLGVAPKYLEQIIGRRVAEAVKRNTPVRFERLK
jgi:sialic acid synthase SpsE